MRGVLRTVYAFFGIGSLVTAFYTFHSGMSLEDLRSEVSVHYNLKIMLMYTTNTCFILKYYFFLKFGIHTHKLTTGSYIILDSLFLFHA